MKKREGVVIDIMVHCLGMCLHHAWSDTAGSSVLDHRLDGQRDSTAQLFEEIGFAKIYQYRCSRCSRLPMRHHCISLFRPWRCHQYHSATPSRTRHLFIRLFQKIASLHFRFHMSPKCKYMYMKYISLRGILLFTSRNDRCSPYTMNSKITANHKSTRWSRSPLEVLGQLMKPLGFLVIWHLARMYWVISSPNVSSFVDAWNKVG